MTLVESIYRLEWVNQNSFPFLVIVPVHFILHFSLLHRLPSLSLSLPPSVYLLEAEEVTLTQKQDVEEEVTVSLDKKEEKPKEGLFSYLHVVSSFSHVCSHAFYVGVASLLCVIQYTCSDLHWRIRELLFSV